MPHSIDFSRFAWAVELVVGHQDIEAIDGSVQHIHAIKTDQGRVELIDDLAHLEFADVVHVHDVIPCLCFLALGYASIMPGWKMIRTAKGWLFAAFAAWPERRFVPATLAFFNGRTGKELWLV